MSPADRKSPIPPEVRERIEAWLRYSDTLGINSFFLDRVNSSAASAAGQVTQVEISEPSATEPIVSSAPNVIVPNVKTSAPQKQSSRTQSAVLPIVQPVSLFEESDRIAGDTLDRIREDIGECTRCRLHKKRTNIVFGVGDPEADLVFVGEGPGRDEDVQGIPFVGRAGKLLTQMIEAMGLRRDDVYICNVVKCRPPENRTPEKDETSVCSPYLVRQIDVTRPKVIVCLGSVAAQTLLNTNQSLSRFRGEWQEYRGARLMCTYHPAYLLRNPSAKGEVWKDLQKVMAVLGLQPPKKTPQR